MRIIGGEQRGLRLSEPGRGAEGLRPTADRTREAIFNLLVGGRFGDPVEGARVLDLFAGTGAMALEALSRGAAEATLVEQGRLGQRLIRENLRRMGREGQARLLPLDATRLPPHAGPPHTLAFLDPPYGQGLGERAMAATLGGGWLAPGALVVWEEAGPVTAPGLAVLEARRYGAAMVTLLRAS